jgi:hypothetical protein
LRVPEHTESEEVAKGTKCVAKEGLLRRLKSRASSKPRERAISFSYQEQEVYQ